MMRWFCVLTVALGVFAAAAQEKDYSCSLKVGNPKTESKKTESSGKGNSRSTQIETTRRKTTWPVKVSFRGKSVPSGIRLNCVFVGRTDGTPEIIGKQTADVALNEKGDFSLDVVSPEAVMVEKKKTSGGRRNRSTQTETSGTRITGCVIQLLVGTEVERVYTTKPIWTKIAKKYPLAEEEILKLR